MNLYKSNFRKENFVFLSSVYWICLLFRKIQERIMKKYFPKELSFSFVCFWACYLSLVLPFTQRVWGTNGIETPMNILLKCCIFLLPFPCLSKSSKLCLFFKFYLVRKNITEISDAMCRWSVLAMYYTFYCAFTLSLLDCAYPLLLNWTKIKLENFELWKNDTHIIMNFGSSNEMFCCNKDRHENQ